MNDSQSQPAVSTKRSRIVRWMAILLAGCLLVITTLIALAPTLLSTSAGTARIVQSINQAIPGTVRLQNLEITWFSSLYVHDLQSFDPMGEQVVSIDRILIPDTNLWSLITGNRDLGDIQVQDMYLNIVQEPDGTTNLHNTFIQPNVKQTENKSTESTTKGSESEPFATPSGTINLINTRINYQSETVPLTNLVINGSLDLDASRRLSIHANTQVSHNQFTVNVNSQVELIDLINEQGNIHTDQVKVDFDITSPDIPMNAVEHYLEMDGELVHWLGNTGQLALRGEFSRSHDSNIDLTLTTATTSLDIPLTIGSRLTLYQDATASLALTPQSSAKWLYRLHPMLNEAIASNKPIKVTIKKEHFTVPLTASDISQIQLEGKLDLGTINFKDQGLINNIRTVFKQDRTNTPTATFTPANIRLANGVLQYDSMSMSLDNLILGFQGSIDQVNNHLDMTMTIASQTMAKAFNLEDVIEPGYEFPIPIHGSIDRPELDLDAVTNEAARLALRSQIKKELPGTEGQAADLLLDILFDGASKTEPASKEDASPLPLPQNPEKDPAQALIENILLEQLDKALPGSLDAENDNPLEADDDRQDVNKTKKVKKDKKSKKDKNKKKDKKKKKKKKKKLKSKPGDTPNQDPVDSPNED